MVNSSRSRSAAAPPPPDQGEGPRTRTEAVHAALRQAILEQSLLPGARLPEDAIGETFGTSRTIAREALGRLAVEGLVELRPNRGAFVAQPSLDEGRDAFAVRAGLERVVVQQLAGRLSAADEQRLRALVRREHEAAGHDAARSVRLAGEFHLALAALTGNPLLQRYVTEVVSRCSLILAAYGRPHASDCAVSDHEALVDALAAGRVDEAVSAMDRHLGEVADRALPRARAARDIREVLAPYGPRVSRTPAPG